MNNYQDNFYNEPPDYIGENDYSGADVQADGAASKVFVIDRNGEFETKSKDVLDIHFNRRLSDEHFSTAWSPTAAVYSVDNLTKREKGKPSETYSVAFYRSKSGELILSSCDCPARLRCKHIIHAWRKHADAENTGFVPTI